MIQVTGAALSQKRLSWRVSSRAPLKKFPPLYRNLNLYTSIRAPRQK
jgi:hypothetical protein